MSYPTDSLGQFVGYLGIVMILYLIFYMVMGGGVSLFFWIATNPIYFYLLITAIIAIICLMFFKIKSEEQEEKRVKKILKENSIDIEERIISQIIYLKKNRKKVFCNAYGISTENEEILMFIAKNWVSSNDINKDEMARLSSRLTIFNGRYDKNTIFISLKGTLPKSFINNVLVRDNYICQKCGKNLLDFETMSELSKDNAYIELIKPLSEGGTLTGDNLITACKESCDHHLVPSKELFKIYENSYRNSDLNLLKFEKGNLSFCYPDYYLIANIPNNCPDCFVALTKNDGKCDILIEKSNSLRKFNDNIGLFNFKFMEHVRDFNGFYDIQNIPIEKLNEKRWRINDPENKSCFIAIADAPKDSDINGLVKSIIYFDFNYTGRSIKITINSLLQDDYDNMGDLYAIANSLEYIQHNFKTQ